MEPCSKMIQKPGMPEPRPCFREKGHGGRHSPDLTGLKNIFAFKEALGRAPDYITTSGHHNVAWRMLDNYGCERNVPAFSLFRNENRGLLPPRGLGLGSKDSSGYQYPEYTTLKFHCEAIFNKKHPGHNAYKNTGFYSEWNPKEGGSLIVGTQWLRKNDPKPGPNYEFHVLKTDECPHGFIRPYGTMWIPKTDRHHKTSINIIASLSDELFEEVIERERNRRSALNGTTLHQ